MYGALNMEDGYHLTLGSGSNLYFNDSVLYGRTIILNQADGYPLRVESGDNAKILFKGDGYNGFYFRNNSNSARYNVSLSPYNGVNEYLNFTDSTANVLAFQIGSDVVTSKALFSAENDVVVTGSITSTNAQASTILRADASAIDMTRAGANYIRATDPLGTLSFTVGGNGYASPSILIKATGQVDLDNGPVTTNFSRGSYNTNLYGTDPVLPVLHINAATNRVGILNGSPSAELDVTGDITASGNLTLPNLTWNGDTLELNYPTTPTAYHKAIKILSPGMTTGDGGQQWVQMLFGHQEATGMAAEFSFATDYNGTAGRTAMLFGMYNAQYLAMVREAGGGTFYQWERQDNEHRFMTGGSTPLVTWKFPNYDVGEAYAGVGGYGLQIDTGGTSSGNPAILGFGGFGTTGESARFQFGDAYNCIQNEHSQSMVIQSYHSMVFRGSMSALNAVAYTDPLYATDDAVAYRFITEERDSFVITQDSLLARTVDWFRIEDGAGTPVLRVSSTGDLTVGGLNVGLLTGTELVNQVPFLNASGELNTSAELSYNPGNHQLQVGDPTTTASIRISDGAISKAPGGGFKFPGIFPDIHESRGLGGSGDRWGGLYVVNAYVTGNLDMAADGGAGNIVMSTGATVDGRDVSADGAKLDGIAAGAEVNIDPVEDTPTTTLTLDNPMGRYSNMGTANSATTYTTTGTTLGASCIVLINAASEPTVTGGTKIPGATFAANTDMYMVVNYMGSSRGVEYYFIALS